MGRWTDGVRREQLPNGLTLLACRDASAPVAAVITHVKAGFFDEPDHWVGVSHVLEHMFFKGTPTRGPGRIAQDTKALGGYLNAGTSYDYTTYYVVLPAPRVATAIDIQADALRHALVDEDELRRELQVIIQEAKRKRDTPSALTSETLFAVMFDRHRIRRWRIGHEDHLAGLTREDIAGYYRSRYVPRNTIVSIVGDIDVDQVMAQCRDCYGDWEDHAPAEDPSPAEPPHEGARVRTLRGDVAQSHLALGWPGVPPLHEDAPALELAAAVLSQGRGSHLYRRLREPGLASAVAAYSFSPTELGVFGLGAELEPERLPEVLDGAGEVLSHLCDRGPTAPDLDRARTLLLTRWARRFETMDGFASALAAAEALGDYRLLDEELERIATLMPGDVRDALRRYVEPGRVAAVAYLPEGRGDDLVAEDVTRRLSSPGTPLAAVEQIAVDPPRAVRVSAQRTDVATTVALDGADLVLRPKPGAPTMSLGVYWARTPRETVETAGHEALAVRSAIRGIGSVGAAGVADAFERLGGSVAPVVGGDRVGYSCSILADHVVEGALLLRRLVEDAALTEASLATERSVLIDEARHRTDDMFHFPFELAFGAAFGDRGYGVPVLGTVASLEGLDLATARDSYRARAAAARLVVVAVGEMDAFMLADRLAGVFGDRPPVAAGTEDGSAPALEATQERVRSAQRDRAQSALALVFPGPQRSSPDRFAAEIWAGVASGLGGRLFEILRSQQSLAYTVLASSWQRRTAGAVVTYIATSPEREDEAREGMFRELERFGREPCSAEELDLAASYLIGQRQVRRQSGAAVAGELVEAWFAGEGLDELRDAEARYRAVSAEQVMELAERVLRRELAVEGIVRGRPAAD